MATLRQLPGRILRRGQRTLYGAREFFVYLYVLKNGLDVWRFRKRKTRLPTLRFRNGLVWNHGTYDDPIECFSEIYVHGFYDGLTAPQGATILDIGANIGAVSLKWVANRPDLCLHLYEPNPAAFASLCRNVRDSGVESQVVLHNEAVGKTAGNVDLWIDVPTVLSTAYGTAPAEGAQRISVPMVSLEDAWTRIGKKPIWMLKIDTEGAEGDILDGASNELLSNVRNAFIEWHNNIVPGVLERCRQRLDDNGFTYRLRPHPWDEGIIYAARNS